MPKTMTTEQTLLELGTRPVTDYNRKDWEAVRRSVSSSYVYDEPATQRKSHGPEEAITVWRGWADAFPDSQGEIHTTYVSGDTVVIELTWRGTHTGSLRTPTQTIPPTGKRIELRACQLNTIADGKLQSTRHYFDLATLTRQLGLTS